MSADEVLRKGSGTLCESLLMVEAYAANVICPNKQQDDSRAMHDGRLLESETYVGGHVECLQTGVYRNNLPIKFRLEPEALQVRRTGAPTPPFPLPDPLPPLPLPLTPHPLPPHQGLLDRLDETLQYAIEHEGGVSLSEVTNYDEVKEQIASRLRELRDNPERKETPIIYHLDVGAMYPNIILTNRLQPPATVSEQMCAACVHNRPESNCKRPLKWMWRGEVFPASKAESDNIRNQLEYATVIELTGYRPPAIPYHSLPYQVRDGHRQGGQRAAVPRPRRGRAEPKVPRAAQGLLPEGVQEDPRDQDGGAGGDDVPAREPILHRHGARVPRPPLRVQGAQQEVGEEARRGREGRRHRIAAGGQVDVHAVRLSAGDGPPLPSHHHHHPHHCLHRHRHRHRHRHLTPSLSPFLQLAHKCILNSFYGYVMRKGARWYSMEMAGVVTYTGANIIKEARTLVEQLGKTLELDTDGIWCVFPSIFPQDFTVTTTNEKKPKVGVSYPCVMLNVDVDKNCHNSQYQVKDPETGARRT